MDQLSKDTRSISMIYTNYRGETSTRHIVPINITFGSTEYHPEPQWILSGHDMDKSEYREFALRDCDFTQTSQGAN